MGAPAHNIRLGRTRPCFVRLLLQLWDIVLFVISIQMDDALNVIYPVSCQKCRVVRDLWVKEDAFAALSPFQMAGSVLG